jgi:O-antigen ligase
LQNETSADACNIQPAETASSWQRYLWLIAFLPLIQALLTWDIDGKLDDVQYAVRHLSIPALVFETIVIAYAHKFGAAYWATLRALPKHIMMLITVGLLFSISASLFQGENRLFSIILMSIYILHGMFFIATVHIISNTIYFRLEYWLSIISIGITTYIIALIIFALALPDPINFPWDTRLPSATNIRQIANIIAIPAAAPIALLLYGNESKRRFGSIILFCIILFIAWSGSRAALTAAIASSFISLIFVRKLPEIKSLVLFIISITMGLAISILLPNPSPVFGLMRMVNRMQDTKDLSSGRVQLWIDTASEISKHPWLGFGSGRFRHNMSELYGIHLNHPHNFILQFAYDWGIFGATAMVMLLSYLLWVIWKKAPSNPLTGFAASSGFLTLCSISMIDGAFFYPLTIIAAIMLIAPLIANQDKDSGLSKT